MIVKAFQKRALRGFTLIELLVVIAIIGILASVILASLNTARIKARDTRRLEDVKEIQLALSLYYDANGNTYPTNIYGGALAPTYISVVPTDPVGATQYKYSALGSGATCSTYHLGAILEDSTNAALSQDADAAAGTNCTGGTADFNGASAACTTTAGTDQCYDVKP